MSESYKFPTAPPSLWTLIFLLSFPAVAAIFFTPSLPAIMEEFQLSKAEVSLAVTAFLLCYGVSQLLYAPIANKFGRKNALYVGIFLAIVSSLLGAFSADVSFRLLVFARALQGLGSGAGLNITFTIINDFYYKEQARRILPLVSLSFATLPVLAMVVAGVFTTYISWKSVFYAFALYSLFILWRVKDLPETYCKKSAQELTIKRALLHYSKGIVDPRLVSYSLLFGCTTSMIYLFAANAPILVVERWGYSASFYGLLSLIPSLGYVSGNLLARGLSSIAQPRNVMALGIVLMLTATSFMQHFWEQLGIMSLFIPAYFLYVGIPLSHTNASLLATTHFEDRSSGSSIMSFCNVTFAFVSVQLAEALPKVTIPIAFFTLLGLMMMLFVYSRHYD